MTIYVTLDQIKASIPRRHGWAVDIMKSQPPNKPFPLSLLTKSYEVLGVLEVFKEALPKGFPYRQFSRFAALKVAPLWKAPPVVIQYLKTGDESLREAASEACGAVMMGTNPHRRKAPAIVQAATTTSYAAASFLREDKFDRDYIHGIEAYRAMIAAREAACAKAAASSGKGLHDFLPALFDEFEPDKPE